MDNLGIYWNKDKTKYSSKVQTISQIKEGYYYCSKYLRKPQTRSTPLKLEKEVFKKIATVEFTQWTT